MWQDPNFVPRPRAPFEQDPGQRLPGARLPGNPGNRGDGHGGSVPGAAAPGRRTAARRAEDIIAGLRGEQRKARLWMAASVTTLIALLALAACAIVAHQRSTRLEASWPAFFLMSVCGTYRFARRLARLRAAESSLREGAGGPVSPSAP